MPMKQNLLSQIETNYQISEEYDSKKQANIQIDILKEIAIKGKQTKPELVESLGHTYRTIAITLSRDENKNIKKNLFWRNGSISKKNITQSQYSLTNRAMIILMLGHYKDKDKDKIPYLNFDEFLKFCSIFEKEHSYKTITKSLHELKITSEPLISLYLTSNSSAIDQLGSKFKNNKELQKLVSSIKSDELESQRIDEKTIQLKENIQTKKYEMGGILQNIIISLLKK